MMMLLLVKLMMAGKLQAWYGTCAQYSRSGTRGVFREVAFTVKFFDFIYFPKGFFINCGDGTWLRRRPENVWRQKG